MSLTLIITAAVVAVIGTVAASDDGNSTTWIDGVEHSTGPGGNLYPVHRDWRRYVDHLVIFLFIFLAIIATGLLMDYLLVTPTTP